MVSRAQHSTAGTRSDAEGHVNREGAVEAMGGSTVLSHASEWSTVELFHTPRVRKAALSHDAAIAGHRASGADSVSKMPREPRPGSAAEAGEAGDAEVRGRLASLTVADVVQWLCLMSKTGILTVDSAGCQTSIFVEQGSVIHAENGSCRAKEALLQALWLKEGSFAFAEQPLECERSIVGHIESLVLQAAFEADRAAHSEELAPASSAA